MINFQVPLLAKKVIETLEKNGFQAYIVGGAIRDLLMHKATYDWDFTTDAKPQDIQKLFPESFYDNVFGTVGITVENLQKQFNLTGKKIELEIDPQQPFEITTFRSESEYLDKRHPDKVSWGKSINDDLQRRDFTMNAIALRITNNESQITNHELIDPFMGQEDIKNKLVRCVGNPDERFKEDALRMMRAIRLAAELNFCIEEKTLTSIMRNSSLIIQISWERIRDEFFKLLASPFPADAVKILYNSGLLQHIIPELAATQQVEQAGHHTKDVWNHSLDSLSGTPSQNYLIRLAALIHDIGKPVAFRQTKGKITFYGHEVIGGRLAKKIADRLKFSKEDKEKLWLLVRYHMFAYEPLMTDAAIRRFIQRIGKENINDMMMLRIGDRKGGGSKATSWRLRELQERIGKLMYTPLSVNDLKIDGHEVMKVLGLKPGPKVGKILNQLFDEVMEDSTKNNREYLLKRIKEI